MNTFSFERCPGLVRMKAGGVETNYSLEEFSEYELKEIDSIERILAIRTIDKERTTDDDLLDILSCYSVKRRLYHGVSKRLLEQNQTISHTILASAGIVGTSIFAGSVPFIVVGAVCFLLGQYAHDRNSLGRRKLEYALID